MTNAIKRLDRLIGWLSDLVATLLLLLLVVVVLYNVLLRYGFEDPPFWTDRVGTSANMAMVLIGLSLAVRHRDLIAMQALYDHLPERATLLLDALWNAVILCFSLLFVWHGTIAAANLPGMYWDFQTFCIDMDLGPPQSGLLITTVKLFEDVIALLIAPLCVDGAVPQKYMAMLMPVSGGLLVISSLGVIIEDIKKIAASGHQEETNADR